MSIFKINTSWIKSVEGVQIGETFGDAWSTILNAIRGSWGDITIDLLPDEPVQFQVTQNEFQGALDTTTEGLVTISVPYESEICFIKVQDISGIVVSSEITYILENSTTLAITLNSGRKIISVRGKAKRV